VLDVEPRNIRHQNKSRPPGGLYDFIDATFVGRQSLRLVRLSAPMTSSNAALPGTAPQRRTLSGEHLT
jgi:hypothetical protein